MAGVDGHQLTACCTEHCNTLPYLQTLPAVCMGREDGMESETHKQMDMAEIDRVNTYAHVVG